MANSEHLEILKKKWHWNPFKKADDAWYKWRQANPQIAPDLRTAFLFKRDLRDQNFSDVDFREANLVGATLSRTDFRRANLSGAYLNSADLYRADLRGAIFKGTDLTQSNLSVTVLDGTNFDGAVFGGTIFGDTDLLAAEGLENAIHLFPSILGTDTLERAKGKLPIAFLRGCGLSDLDIEREKLRNWQLTAFELDQVLRRISDLYVARVSEHYSCFISYSHADQPFARGLYEKLQQRGIRCWLDEKQLLPGDDIYEQVDRGIRLWDKVLLCCSQHSLSSWWVDNEITAAFAKEQQIMKERGKKVLALIPLNLDGYLFKWANGKAKQVLSRFAPDFTGCTYGGSEFEAQIERIIASLRVDESARETPPESRL